MKNIDQAKQRFEYLIAPMTVARVKQLAESRNIRVVDNKIHRKDVDKVIAFLSPMIPYSTASAPFEIHFIGDTANPDDLEEVFELGKSVSLFKLKSAILDLDGERCFVIYEGDTGDLEAEVRKRIG